MKKIITVLTVFLCFQTLNSQTWVRTLDGYSIWSLGKDFDGNVYAGVSGTPRNIFKSSNGGSSWDTVYSNGVTNFLSIACDSLNNVYAANGSNGMLKSTNGGANWTAIPSGVFGNKNVQTIACGRNGYVYVGCVIGGIYRSTDYGATFPDNMLSSLTVVTLAVDRFNPNIIYAGASSASPPNYGFYRSTDGGLNFSGDLNPLNIWGIAERQNGDLFTVTTSTGYEFDKSTNGGLNWSAVSNLSGAMRGLCMDLSENFYAAGNGGVFKSTNSGAGFTNFNMTFTSNQIISYQNKILVAASGTTNGGVYVYTDSLVGIKQIINLIPDGFNLYQNYPNPFNPQSNIQFRISKFSIVKLIIYDVLGREVSVLANQSLSPGYL